MSAHAEESSPLNAMWARFYDLVARRQLACRHAVQHQVELRPNPRYGDHHGLEPWLLPFRRCERCGLKEEARRLAGHFRFDVLDQVDAQVERVSLEESTRRSLEACDLILRYVGLEESLVGPRRGPKRSPNRPGVVRG